MRERGNVVDFFRGWQNPFENPICAPPAISAKPLLQRRFQNEPKRSENARKAVPRAGAIPLFVWLHRPNAAPFHVSPHVTSGVAPALGAARELHCKTHFQEEEPQEGYREKSGQPMKARGKMRSANANRREPDNEHLPQSEMVLG
jgi:hypothetical protein